MTATAVTALNTPTNKMTLREFLNNEKIFEISLLPFKEVSITDSKKAERVFNDFDAKTVVLFLIPYYVKTEEKGNISRYAYARDYHFYFKLLSARLDSIFPFHFRHACDSSPINEVEAAVKAGLGSFGRHGLIINKRYGSYVFVAEFFSDLDLTDPLFEGLERKKAGQICLGCGKCEKACPASAFKDKTKCISFINQKKNITEEESEIIKNSALVWGCDICQEVCPLNLKAEESEIPFFRQDLTVNLTEKVLDTIDFKSRAYAWRGEKVIRRNIKLKEEV